jgi:hypothetical protein
VSTTAMISLENMEDPLSWKLAGAAP